MIIIFCLISCAPNDKKGIRPTMNLDEVLNKLIENNFPFRETRNPNSNTMKSQLATTGLLLLLPL